MIDLGIAPATLVMPKGTEGDVISPKGRVLKKCPAQISDKVSCAKCKWCAIADRWFGVYFEEH